MIVELLNKNVKAKDDLIFFDRSNSYYYKMWQEAGMNNINLKDLRRASLYHLGQEHKFAFTDLMHQSRHADSGSIMFYLRRPDETLKDDRDELDLGA